MVDTADRVLSNLRSIDNIDADRVLSNLRDLPHSVDNIDVDRVPSNLRDLPHSIDNIDAAIVHMLAERFRRTYRGDVR